MNKRLIFLTTFVVMSAIGVQSCAGGTSPQAEAPTNEPASPTQQATAPTSDETGTLQIRANGEDFIRQGFVSKDGWQIDFDHVYVNLDQITAYQTDPPFDPEADQSIDAKAQTEVRLEGIKTIDLAEGGEDAEPILVGEVEAPVGRYNALSWQMVKAPDGPAAGYPLMLQGTASKDGQSVDFTLRFDEELSFTCGDFVGDERKGIVQAGQTADLEATFHFDHLFGDADTPAEDALNTGALGFDPLAAIAENGQLDADLATLEKQLSPEDYTKLVEILPSLGHVGEGHCQETTLTS
ncbi:DUF4382 domain-containing protein [Thermocoleostomius sinensis]|uniref:DUF4382 domain-containing protein n=1 Tax=Thermocoleostomius sinensis A174 TaxID=2016057 RepID=A0A9E8Z8N1_9CYAN|nr:DUF4382 domain-containing protein [Thermocoleostomius sinensis]WAL58341.1 DUF4382 domain-containing protein [Thermocoleostomius sinensis A174]